MNTEQAALGEALHFLAGGVTYIDGARSSQAAVGVVSRRGDEVTITEGLRTANTDRNGFCWLDLLHDPEAQVERYGRVIIAPGPFPEGELLTEPGTTEHAEAAVKAYSAARQIADRTERKAALREVAEKYGPPRPTSSSMAYGPAR